MSRERIEHESLAAFLDGKLEGAERERVMRILAEHPEEYEVFADAARAAAELRGGAAVPIESRHRRGGWKLAIPLLAAAGLAAIVMGTRGILRLTQTGMPTALVLASNLGAPAEETGWALPPWSADRGEVATLHERSTAFRIGARLVDLDVAARDSAQATARQIALDLSTLASGVLAGGPVAARFEQIALAPTRDRALLAETAGAAARLLQNSPWLESGAWLEAARLAALTRTLEFFTPRHAAQARLEFLIADLPAATRPGDPNLLPGLRRLLASMRTGVSPEALPAIRLLLDSLLTQGAR